MKKQKRKEVLKFIRKAVEVLPAETYKAYHKYWQPRWEKDDKGEEVFRYGYLGDHNANHYRRCKKAYDNYGYAGINAYLMMFGYRLSTNPE